MTFDPLNGFGAGFVILLLIPNIVYALRNRGEKNDCTNRILNLMEQVGRYACIVLMWLPLGVWKFGFPNVTETLLYFAVNIVSLILYWILFSVYTRRKSRKIALALAVLPSLIFFFSGSFLRHWLLVLFAVVFAVGHVGTTMQNTKLLERTE
ncbi:MAG: hypothetical protein IJ091_04465 [Oscillospiraceae bacterium]|nr:hypothetical protein [Oscillospiraceae bacterium]